MATTLGAVACLANPRPAAGPAPASERNRVIHLLSRATYGVRPQDVDDAVRLGRSAWLERQLDPSKIPDSAATARIAALSSAAPNVFGVAQRVAAAMRPDTAAAAVRAALVKAEQQLAEMQKQGTATGTQLAEIRLLISRAQQQLVSLQTTRPPPRTSSKRLYPRQARGP